MHIIQKEDRWYFQGNNGDGDQKIADSIQFRTLCDIGNKRELEFWRHDYLNVVKSVCMNLTERFKLKVKM